MYVLLYDIDLSVHKYYHYLFKGDHLPLHSDGALLHPDTMRECEVVITSPVVVRNFADTADSSKQVVCKAWPLAQLPLDGECHSLI